MPEVLALDTATDACSAALYCNGELRVRHEIAPRRHTDLILPMVNALLAEASFALSALDAIAFGAGPGSFTGVRIAAAIAQGLALAHDTPVVPISCLELLAVGAAREHAATTVVPLADARKGEIYSAIYSISDATHPPRCLAADRIGEPDGFALPDGDDFLIVGSAVGVFDEAIERRRSGRGRVVREPRYPNARDAVSIALDAIRRGATLPAERALPIYLRQAV